MRRVLLVDDDLVLPGYYVKALRRHGFDVVHFRPTDANEDPYESLLRHIERQVPDLILLDVMMPPGSAFTLEESQDGLTTGVLLYGRLHKKYARIPILLLTVLQTEIVEAQLSNYDSKPSVLTKGGTPPTTLVHIIEDLLRKAPEAQAPV